MKSYPWYKMNNNPQDKKILSVARRIFSDHGFRVDQIEISPLQGGNNRIYKVIVGKKKYIIKNYFRSVNDKRDRLQTEYRFINYAKSCKVKEIPQLFYCDAKSDVVSYEYVDGEKLKKGEVEKEHVQQALAFIVAINNDKFSRSEYGSSLFLASEACLSIEEYIKVVDRRMNLLSAMKISDDISQGAEQFVLSVLVPEWKTIKKSLNSLPETEKKLEKDEQIISPSDFGFHNAIVKNDNQVWFIDFEYAGWDDPVKMICDFFCQPEIPIPLIYLEYFIGGINKIINPFYNLEEKVKLLMPLHRIKWCCIMLNDFLKNDAKRKQFASFNEDARAKQLNKAVEYARQYLG